MREARGGAAGRYDVPMRPLLASRAWLPEALLVAAAAGLFLAGLGTDAMRDWDEATYAAVAREMRASGDWLTPRLDGRPFHDKPPLGFWLIAVAQAALGDTELAARLPSALLGVAGVLAALLLARRLGGRRAGLIAGAMLASAPQWLRFSRQAMLDVPLAAALALAFLAALAGSWAWLGAALAGAILIKGPAALVALPPLAVWAALDRSARATAARGVAAAVALAAPWHAWQLAVHGGAFARTYLGINVAARLGSAVEGNAGPWWYYLEYVFFHWVDPWHWLGAAAAVAFTASALRSSRKPERALLAAWFWTVLVGFSLAATKLHWYAMPIYPALAAITGTWVGGSPRDTARRRAALAGLGVATLALAGAEVGLHRLRNRAAESTRAVLHALPDPADAPVLLVADDLPLGTARYYARRPVGRWTPGGGGDAWVLVRPADALAAPGLRPIAAAGDRALLGPG